MQVSGTCTRWTDIPTYSEKNDRTKSNCIGRTEKSAHFHSSIKEVVYLFFSLFSMNLYHSSPFFRLHRERLRSSEKGGSTSLKIQPLKQTPLRVPAVGRGALGRAGSIVPSATGTRAAKQFLELAPDPRFPLPRSQFHTRVSLRQAERQAAWTRGEPLVADCGSLVFLLIAISAIHPQDSSEKDAPETSDFETSTCPATGILLSLNTHRLRHSQLALLPHWLLPADRRRG